MRIGIAGYGNMGALIYRRALEHGHEVPVIVDPVSNAPEVTTRKLTPKLMPLDVIIDFTSPETVITNINNYGELKVSAVIGTTGWYDQIDQVEKIVEKSGIGLIWAANFSLGANLFYQIVRATAVIMNRFPHYDAAIHEHHHRYKTDSPSGTAKVLGDLIISKLERKTKLSEAPIKSRLAEDELNISSTRVGSVPGTHKVIFDSDVDAITLEHSARSREGFAAGALLAAEWVAGKSGLYTIDDLVQSLLGGDIVEKYK